MPREATWFERSTDDLPDTAPEADEGRVMLRVTIGRRPEAPRVTIPRLDPPGRAAGPKAAEEAGTPGGAGAAEALLEPGASGRAGPGERMPDSETAPSAGPGEAVPDPEEDAGTGPGLSWPPAREELEALVARGLSNREIAELYGVPRDTVAWRLSKLGIRRSAVQRQALQQRGGRKAAARLAEERSKEAAAGQAPEAAPEIDPDRAMDLFFRSLARACRLAQEMGVAMEVSVRVGRAS